MAACYNCGLSGASYRRVVNTGYSIGSYSGKRTSYSTRSYYGKRSLCEDCAYSHDRSGIIAGIVLRWIVVIILTYLIYHYKF